MKKIHIDYNMIGLGEERIEKNIKARVTKVPLLIAIWIKVDRMLIDHHPSRRQQNPTKETLKT